MSDEQAKTQKQFPLDYYQFDSEDAKKTILAMHDHIREAYRLTGEITPKKTFSHLAIAGMGGSGIAGDFIAYVVKKESTLPVTIIKSYDIPETVNEDTLFIGVTYSGNTEETLSAYKMASRKGAQCILLSSGGKAEDLAQLNKHQHIKIPKGLQPRMAIAYLFFPILRVLENADVIPAQEADIKETVEAMRKQRDTGSIELSEKIYRKIPVIYADADFYPVAYRWKTQFNENAKTPAFCHAFSELNHNELLSWTNRSTDFHIIILTTDNYHRRVIKRIDLTKDFLQKKGVSVTEIAIKGSALKQLFSAILLGDMTSYYLALRYETDPTPVKDIEQFKKSLGPFLI